jgi:hypothetical protein
MVSPNREIRPSAAEHQLSTCSNYDMPLRSRIMGAFGEQPRPSSFGNPHLVAAFVSSSTRFA